MGAVQGLPRPLPPPQVGVPVAPATPPHRSKRRPWIIAGSIALGVVVLGMCAVGLEEALTHDLLSEDFSEDGGTFFTGSLESYSLEVKEGAYQLSATSAAPDPVESIGFFARRAYNVEISATVVAVDAYRSASVGLECVNAAGGGQVGGRYLFTVSTRGNEGYVIARVTGSVADARPLATRTGPALQNGQRLGLHCNGEWVFGLIDGIPVISAADRSFGSFEAAALVFGPAEPGEWVRFDDIVAEVPPH